MVLIIKKWEGRLGNQIIQLKNAIQIALFYKENLIFPKSNFFIKNQLKFNKKNKYPIFDLHNFFLKSKLIKIYDSHCFEKNLNLTRNILNKLFKLKYNLLNSLDDDILVIHIRSGDIFTKYKGIKSYIVPPLIFYENIIDNNLFKKIIIISEDSKNPIIQNLLDKYNKITFNIQNLEKDIITILRARNIVLSVGSFVPGLLYLTKHTKTIYTSNYALKKLDNKFINKNVSIKKFDYEKYYNLQKYWKNSERNINLMLNYKIGDQ